MQSLNAEYGTRELEIFEKVPFFLDFQQSTTKIVLFSDLFYAITENKSSSFETAGNSH